MIFFKKLESFVGKTMIVILAMGLSTMLLMSLALTILLPVIAWHFIGKWW